MALQLNSTCLVASEEDGVLGATSACSKADLVLVTIQSRGIFLYSTETQKSAKSWLFEPGTKFSSPALMHASQNVLAVQDGKFLLRWALKDKVDLKSIPRTSFDGKGLIHGLQSTPLLKNHFAVVFANGAVGVADMSAVLSATAEPPKTNKKSICLWSTAFDAAGAHLVLVLRSSSEQLCLDVFSITDGGSATFFASHKVSSPLTELGKDPVVSASFDVSTSTLAILFRDVSLSFSRVSDPEELFAENSLRLTHTVPRLACFAKKSKSSGLAVTFARSGQLLLAGPSAKSSQYLFTVWDSFRGVAQGSLEAVIFDHVEEESNARPILTAAFPIPPSGPLVLVGPSGVFLAAHSFPSPTLANALDSFALTRRLQGLPEDSSAVKAFETSFIPPMELNLEKLSSSESTFVELTADQRKTFLVSRDGAVDSTELDCLLSDDGFTEEDKFLAALKVLIDTTLVNEKQKRKKELKIESDAMEIDAPAPAEETDGAEKKGRGRRSRKGSQTEAPAPAKESTGVQTVDFALTLSLSPQVVRAIVHRILHNPTKVPWWKALHFMLLSRALYSNSIVPDLFQILISKNKYSLLLEALLGFQDVSAPSLVDALVAFLSAEASEVVAAVKSKSSNVDMSAEEARTCALNVIISKPFTAQLLRASLKRLSDSQTIAVLSYLLQWWKLYENHTETMLHENRPKYLRVPQFRSIVQWSSLLIDSHLAALILNSEASALVTELHGMLKRHIALVTNLSALQGAIDFVSAKRVDLRHKSDYEVAWIKFPDRGQFIASSEGTAVEDTENA